jgi:hypothetical protein
MFVKFTLSFFINGHSNGMTRFCYENNSRTADDISNFFINVAPPVSKTLLEDIYVKAAEVAARIKN